MGPVNGNDSPASASALSGLLLSPRYEYHGPLNAALCTTSTIARSAANHELGHLFWLDHCSVVIIAIMNITRDRTAVYVPKYDDIQGVEAVYYLGGE